MTKETWDSFLKVMNDDPNTDVIDLTKEKLSKIIADTNKDNAPADGWKKEDRLTNEEAAASLDLETSDFSDDGEDLEELKDIMEGN